MKNTFKDSKWWMYIPFACLTMPMAKWVFFPDTRVERANRLIFVYINLFESIIFLIFILFKIGLIR